MCMHTHLHLCSDLTYHMRDVIYAMIWTHIYIYIYIYILVHEHLACVKCPVSKAK